MDNRVVSRRLFAGVALTALSAGAALADTPFTTFAFPATGGTANRTEPNRWADWHNVLDFGADPTFMNDSTAAIQACINWQTATDLRGTIYFPPGLYKITAPLLLPTGTGTSIILRGDGEASNLSGNVNGYIIDRYDASWTHPSGTIIIEKLSINNNVESAAHGAVRLGNCVGSTVRDCSLTGMNGLTLNQCEDDPTWLSNSCSVINTKFQATGNRTVGSTALNTGNGTAIANFDASGYDCAIRMIGKGCTLFGGRMEVNNFSIIFGINQNGTQSRAVGCYVGGPTNESFHDTAYDLVHADGCVIYQSGTSTFVGANYGVRFRADANYCTYQSGIINGGFGVAAIVIEDGGVRNTLINVTNSSVSWVMPTKAITAKFINCNNPAPIFTLANLPTGADVVVGDEYIISNSSLATSAANFGSVVSTGANTAKVRWNGSNWIIV